MLAKKHCVSCKGQKPIAREKAKALLKKLDGWRIADAGKWLRKDYKFKNFVEALAFVTRVGKIAEAEQHHPDIDLGWGYVRLALQTHDVGGLHENDFIVAAKIDALPS